jgi:hypothetical protein
MGKSNYFLVERDENHEIESCSIVPMKHVRNNYGMNVTKNMEISDRDVNGELSVR